MGYKEYKCGNVVAEQGKGACYIRPLFCECFSKEVAFMLRPK